MKGASLQREWQILITSWACTAKVLLELVQCEILLEILGLLDQHELLSLLVSQQAKSHTTHSHDSTWRIAYIKSVDSQYVVLA
jgi:hypothetical protein